MSSLVTPGSKGEAIGRLVLAGFVVSLLPLLPFGAYLAYPFFILTTWFHEMGHGLTAALLGQSFERLVLLPNGSGYAEYLVRGEASRLVQAAIAIGGPLAPSVVGSALIVASAHPRSWRWTLWAMVAAILASTIIWVRSATGWWALPIAAAVLGLVAWRASAGFQRFTLQFLGLTAAWSVFGAWRYFLTEQVVIDGQAQLSDTGAIAAVLLLPYWVWAGVILITSAAMFVFSLRYALADSRRGPPPRKLPANVLQFKRR
ncbi:M50 family metallopeptidase [Erythrobacter oryzae]|uniref:M50 family metallopeptidase n=1 Tax=Erythrobacter oryzae TaxID=3019556 RepID=UPI002552D443|nr:M50 family metallopeptidase [Erythrobacter sp. COR-2]